MLRYTHTYLYINANRNTNSDCLGSSLASGILKAFHQARSHAHGHQWRSKQLRLSCSKSYDMGGNYGPSRSRWGFAGNIAFQALRPSHRSLAIRHCQSAITANTDLFESIRLRCRLNP